MKLSPPLIRGRLLRRYKRFLADVETTQGALTLHCPNTGAMAGCSEPGLEVWYSTSSNPARKYRHTLEVVCTALGRVGVNTARANALVAEALAAGRIDQLRGYQRHVPEARIPDSRGRFDFLLEGAGRRCWVEVKSLTLCDATGRGAFPDAVSARALRHVQALEERVRQGDRAVLLFCVQHTGVRYATTADEIHPAYGLALRAAVRTGVEVIAYGCSIERERIELLAGIAVDLHAPAVAPGRPPGG
ncbi:MAG: DNA/RNA nuclease SfsA [Pseudomonadales bacterium]